jgi:hypothetical protein
MATIADIRQQYPQYENVPDVELADALHQKFYSDIPKTDFYKSINLTGASLIPGSITSLPQREVSLRDRLMGIVETPAIVAGGLAAAIPTFVARVGGELYGGRGTPEGKAMGEAAAKTVSAQFYQPRTTTGPELVSQAADFLGSIPPTPLSSAGTALSTLTGPAVNQLRPIVTQAVAPAKNLLVSALQREPAAVMPGMGAAEVAAATMRQERALSQNIRLTKGEQAPELGLQQFESDIVKKNPELGQPLIEFKAGQKQDIIDQMERLTGQTNAEFADPANARQIGVIVDKAMVNAFDAKKAKVDQAYQLARDSGETKQVVDTTKLDQYLTFVQPEAIAVPEINSIKAKLEVLKTAKNGQVTIDDLENLYKVAGQLGKKGDPSGVFMSDIKKIINEVTEGTGGDLYRAARAQRNQLGKEFEDTYRVAKLLGTKGGYADRAVALDDVFKHVVLDGSLEEMRTVTKLLKKAGPEGQQAYKELQGQTIEHLKDLLIKGEGQLKPNSELSFAKFKSAIDSLDREGKLEYMYGKAGRDKLMDLRATVQDALVKDPRAVNWSNSGNVVLRGLDTLVALRFPGAGKAAEIAQNLMLKKKVAESVNFNALAPSKASANRLAP